MAACPYNARIFHWLEPKVSEEHKNKAFVWEGKVLCEDCLIMQGGTPGNAISFWDFQKDQNKAKPHDW